MKTLKILSFVILITFFASCEQDAQTKYSIEGVVQKGPFLTGTSITLFELDQNLVQTGRSFNTTIENNEGKFTLDGIELTSPYVEILANGFYFNEVTGENSEAQLTLYSISDITNKSTINVNILTHLERERVKALVADNKSFSDAKEQAKNEVLNALLLQSTSISSTETLDITEANEGNSILLAASVMLQAKRSVADLSELLSTINLDIKDNGAIDNSLTIAEIANGLQKVDLNRVKQNLDNKYNALSVVADFSGFHTYLQALITENDNLKYDYPDNGNYGVNLLAAIDQTTLYAGRNYSLAANLAKNDKLKIIIKREENTYWSFKTSTISNWSIGAETNGIQTLTSTDDGLIDLNIIYGTQGTIIIEIYEGDAIEPTAVKTFIIEPLSFTFSYPERGNYGENMLVFSDAQTIPLGGSATETILSLAVSFASMEESIEIKIHFTDKDSYSIDMETNSNWIVNESKYETGAELMLQCTGKDITADIAIKLLSAGSCTIEGTNIDHQNKTISWY